MSMIKIGHLNQLDPKLPTDYQYYHYKLSRNEELFGFMKPMFGDNLEAVYKASSDNAFSLEIEPTLRFPDVETLESNGHSILIVLKTGQRMFIEAFDMFDIEIHVPGTGIIELQETPRLV